MTFTVGELARVDVASFDNLAFTVRRNAFALVETIVALFVLALAAILCIAVVQNRDTARDRTAAIGDAPSAIDALQAELEGETVTALDTEIDAGNARRVVYRKTSASETAAPWMTVDTKNLSDSPGAEGPVFIAKLLNAKLYDNSRAIEFDVELGWIRPGLSSETATEFSSRMEAAKKLCTYRIMVLAK